MSLKTEPRLAVVPPTDSPGLEVMAALYTNPYLLDNLPFDFDGSQLDQPHARIVSTMLREREKLTDDSGCFDVKLIISALELDGTVSRDTLHAVTMADTYSDPIVAVKFAAKAREDQLLQQLSGLATDLAKAPGDKKLQSLKDRIDQELTECRAVIEGGEGWEDPIDVGEADLPAFPVDALPGPLRDLCTEVSSSVDIAPGLVACAGLGVISTLTAGRVAVAMSQTWQVPVALYIAALSPSGGGKGPAFKFATDPLRKLQDELRDQELDRFNREMAEYTIAEQKAASLKKEAAKAKGPDAAITLAEATEAAVALGRMQKPELPCYFVNDDFTEAALADKLAANGQRLGIISDEARTMFDSLSGRHSSNNVQESRILLSAYSSESASQIRAGRGEVNLEHPQLSVAVALQPQTFSKFLQHDGLSDAGLFNRFLLARTDWDQNFDSMPSGEVKQRAIAQWNLLVREVAKIPDRGHNGWHLGFTDRARQVLMAQRAKFRAERDPDGYFERLQEYAEKFDGNLIRVVGLLHIAEVATNGECGEIATYSAIETETVERAVRIMDYFAAHAVGILSAAAVTPEDRGAAIVRDRLQSWMANPKDAREKFERKAGRVYVSLRNLQRYLSGGRRFLRDRAQVEAACEVLVENGWLRKAKRPVAGRGPAGSWWELHPSAFSAVTVDTVEACGGTSKYADGDECSPARS